MSVKNNVTRVGWSLKRECASLIIENFEEAMDHCGQEDIFSSEAFLVCNFLPHIYFIGTIRPHLIVPICLINDQGCIVPFRCVANPFF